ncbi:hypothetical protein OHV05_33665 [Kitasatospora sp. NBC_00070]|uniref:hypothetical protein n=1 Tax=Kitasatospora sp. NBC_00070 TaxID=2975962 RepID=UPI003243AC18
MKRTLRALGPIVAVGVLLLTGCASGADPDGASAGGDQEQVRKFAQCMREHGVDMSDTQDGRIGTGPDPAASTGPQALSSGGAVDLPEDDNAFEKCRAFLPNGGQPQKLSAADLAQRVKFAQCMRSRGIDYPDPTADGQAQAVPMNPNDPQAVTKLDDASRACDADGASGAAK